VHADGPSIVAPRTIHVEALIERVQSKGRTMRIWHGSCWNVGVRTVLLAFLLLGCASRLRAPAFLPQPESALVLVPYPPPPARVEVVPGVPDSRADWIDGEWSWQGDRWLWIRGRWVHPPQGAKYSPWTTVRGQDGLLYYAAGGWRGVGGAEIQAPKALLVACDEPGKLIDDEGNLLKSGKALDPPGDKP
jgi:hypothetical protein